MSGKAFKDVTTADLFKFDPDDVRIDTEGNLADSRTKLPVLETLVLDIMVRGVVEPIVVAKDDKGRPVIIDGRQRLKAAQEANRRLKAQGSKVLVKIPAVYRQGDDLGAYAAMIAANEHRQDDDAIGRAKKVERFLGLGASKDDAAIAFGVTVATIDNWLELLKAGPVLKTAIRSGKISPTAAIPIAKLPREEQAAKVVELVDNGGTKSDGTPKRPTVRQAKAAASRTPGLNGGADGSAATPRPKRTRGRAEIELVMTHCPEELHRMDGVTTLRWVLGSLELPELKQE